MSGFRRNSRATPDLILVNGNILTLCPDLPHAEALAAKDGLIVAVGSNRGILGLACPGTPVIECQGQCVVPGFHDAHIHLLACASRRLYVDCSPRAVTGISEIQSAIQQQSRLVAPGTWIRAGDYDEFQLVEKRHPTRWDLDMASPDHPVKLRHRSLHACVLNSAALRLANLIDRPSPAPGTKIDIDPVTHEPTGLLYGFGDFLSTYVVPPLNEDELRRALRQVFRELLSNGITSVHDASFNNNVTAWNRLVDMRSEGGFWPRIALMVGQPHLAEFIEQSLEPGFGDEWLRLDAVKFMLTEVDGDFHPAAEQLKEQVWQAHRLGYQIAIHAVESSAICLAADAIANARRLAPGPLHRIEHCSEVPPPLVDHLAELGVMVVTQPSFIFHSGDRYLADVDENLHDWLYPIRSLLESGIVVAAGSDAPVVPANPLEGIYAATTRGSRSGCTVANGERVSVEQALKLYTSGPAIACGEHYRKGSIVPGKLADLVVLTADPASLEQSEIKNIGVAMTIIGGNVVWRRSMEAAN